MTERDTIDRFVVEESHVGTVDHIVDLDADSADQSVWASSQDVAGVQLCDRGIRTPACEYVRFPDYADREGIDKTAFEGDAPDEVCSYCWSDVVERDDQQVSAEVADRVGTVGYRLRWKQKGRAREEWYDVVVRPETTMAELDTLVCRFSTLDNLHLRMYGLEDEYLDSSLSVVPDHQCEAAGRPSYTKASAMTVGEVADRAALWEGDRLSMAYDFGTPSHYYCLVKEVYDPDEIDALLDDRDLLATTETAAIIDQKRP